MRITAGDQAVQRAVAGQLAALSAAVQPFAPSDTPYLPEIKRQGDLLLP